MPRDSYSPEQQKDIEERVKKAQDFLKELQLQPSASVQAVNTGNDVFSFKVIPYLQDTKHSGQVSPLTP